MTGDPIFFCESREEYRGFSLYETEVNKLHAQFLSLLYILQQGFFFGK